MHFINSKGQKSELRNSRNVLTNHTKSKSHHLFITLGVDTHTRTHTCTNTHTHTWQHESDIKKPGACWPAVRFKKKKDHHLAIKLHGRWTVKQNYTDWVIIINGRVL